MDDEYEQHFNEVPSSIDPYAVLGLPNDVEQSKVKPAYHKAALAHHPDKVTAEDKDAAHVKFQQIAFAYAILSEPRRREVYDRTGRTEDSMDLDDEDFDWMSFYREQYFETVTTEKIEKFSEQYKGSDEERGHVLRYYEEVKGDMRKLYKYVMLSDVLLDEDRFQEIIKKAIEDDEVEAYPAFTEESEKQRQSRIREAEKKMQREAREAGKAKKDLEKADAKKKGGKARKGVDSTADLAALIQGRKQDRTGRADAFFSKLQDKYGPEEGDEEEVEPAGKKRGGGKGAKRSMEEPSEEMFAANRKRGKLSDDAQGGARRKARKTKD